MIFRLTGLVICLVMFVLNTELCLAKDSTKVKKVNYSGIALPSRTPENGYYIQGGVVGVFKTSASDTLLRSSNAYLYGMYSQMNQWRISFGGIIFTPKEKNIVDFWYYGSFLPEKYFGLNNYNAKTKYEFISYHVLHFETTLLRKISNKKFGGLMHYFEAIDAINYPQNGLMDSIKPVGVKSNSCHGLGLIYRQDSRDFLLSATKGVFVEFSLVPFLKSIGSRFNFVEYKIDLRKYWNLWPQKGHVLAVQYLFKGTGGDVPYRRYPEIGSRAYHPNMFRAKNTQMFQIEYKIKVWKWFGISTFGGLAQANSDISKLPVTNLKPNYGMGLRFKLIPKHNLHLRFDYGIGSGTSNYYLAFYDAF